MSNVNKYYDANAAIQVIGCILEKPSLLDDNNNHFYTEDDFVTSFHRIMFGSIYNLYKMGTQNITTLEIEDYLKNRPEAKATYKAGGGAKWLAEAANNADVLNFDYYYNRLKKMTLLRGYESIGFDMSFFYNPDELFDNQKKARQEDCLDSMSLDEISDLVESKFDKVKMKYVDNSLGESTNVGEGIDVLLEELKQAPELGSPLYGKYINTITRGARLGKLYVRSAATGIGKSVPNNVIIPTPQGNKKVGDIKPGDYLFDAFGKPTKVLAIYPQGKKEVWEVTFKDGRKARCCKDHLWSYCIQGQRLESKKNRCFSTNTLEEISREELYKEGQGYQILVPMQKAVQYPKKQYLIDPYILGLLLGDGSFRCQNNHKSLMFSSFDEELVNHISNTMNWNSKQYQNHSQYSWYFEFKNDLKGHKDVWVEDLLGDYPELLNVYSENKFIPSEYLLGNIEQRFELLNGLLDTDGSVDKEKGRIFYCTVSPKLKDNVVELARSLGFKTSVVEDSHKNTNLYYKIEISGTPEDKIKLFKLQRKKDLILEWFNNGKRKENNLFNPIIKIENLKYPEEMTCFLVDNEEHLFLMNDFIVTHNTRSMIADACYIACNKIYKDGKWQDNGLRQPALYISTELDLQEVQTMALAFLSEVNEEHILKSEYDFGEEERVLEAARILKESPLYIEIIPDFSLTDITNTIKRNIRVNSTQYCFFDYIHSSMKILEEISQRSGGIPLREDNILFLLSVHLKDICTEFNVFILTSTQLNGSWKNEPIPDQNMLRGAKSIADKCDWGSIMLDVTSEDLEALQTLIKNNSLPKPNIKMSIYKNRRGSYNKCFLWIRADKGTCRFDPLFCTDYDYNIIPIADTKIDVKM